MVGGSCEGGGGDMASSDENIVPDPPPPPPRPDFRFFLATTAVCDLDCLALDDDRLPDNAEASDVLEDLV